jgi:glycosyltransferase involved in cell wall biosynthesis
MNELTEKYPTVSVLIVCYNQGKFIEAAMESVITQDYQDYEIIVVNDGSTDRTKNIIENAVKHYPKKIRIVNHAGDQNLGICKSYETGIKSTRGKYIAFLEGDDRWCQSFLTDKVRILENDKNIGVVFSRYKVISESWFGHDMTLRQWLLSWNIPRKRAFRNFNNLLKKNNIATFSAFMIRKSFIDDFVFPKSANLVFLDWLLLVHISKKALFYLDDTSQILWRHYKMSTMGRQKMHQHQNVLIAFMNSLYEELESCLIYLDDAENSYFKRKHKNLGFFADFYSHPNPVHFFSFLKKEPVWALEALFSLIVNYFKFHKSTDFTKKD